MTPKNNLKGSFILCITALIWGLAFVAQSTAAKKVPTFAINSMRSFIAFIILLIFYKIVNFRSEEKFIPTDKKTRKTVLKGALVCGFMLSVSANLQQAGIAAYPEGVASEARAGFLTALYVIIVPLISAFFLKKIHPVIWAAVITAIVGIYFLCFTGGISGIYLGDILMFSCALCFSLHIIVVDKFCGILGGIRLSCLQFLVCGFISLVLSLIFESGTFTFSDVISVAPQILFLAVMSSGIAYTLQIVGQKYAEPAVASITMSLESVFAAIGGWVISGNALSLREILGCLLVFAAIIIAQTPEMFAKKATQK